MDVTDFMKLSVSDRADLDRGAAVSHEFYRAHVEAGFTEDQAMQLLCQLMEADIQTKAMEAFMERQARGEFDGD